MYNILSISIINHHMHVQYLYMYSIHLSCLTFFYLVRSTNTVQQLHMDRPDLQHQLLHLGMD